jgi:putative 4-mercaptohistidine N1-methyltranferase
LNIYETERLLAEYLLFHYGEDSEVLPWSFGPIEALRYPVRCVSDCFDTLTFTGRGRALDLGCAVGRSSFELARYFPEVVGIDYSRRFVAAASDLRDHGKLAYERVDEGEISTPLVARVPSGIDPSRVRFEQGDAMDLRADLGAFDAVLLANLIDRLRDPRRCLARLPALVKPGGQLVISSPYTWLEEFTPRENWLGGFAREGHPVSTRETLQTIFAPDFDLVVMEQLPFLIREHQRKFQWSVAEATIWRRRDS